MKKLANIICCSGVALCLTALPASAYYHFINYLNGASVPEKFDLTALPNGTATIFVSESGPTNYSTNDGFNSVLTQIRQAAAVWNGVSTSALRVAFGGLENANTVQNTPGGDVVFEDLPPGIYGFGGPSSLASPVTAADGTQFLPIIRSTMHLNINMTVLPGPSFNETFFMVAVHEMGHALGLQHTFTSSTMSQATTRATNLTHALGVDDIAGLSVLYPTSAFSQFGSITGQITAGGQGVHLASVVAINAGVGAVSGVTNPDGTYRIDGIPPGQYYVYVHTMPPDANIYGPWNADGSVAAPSGPVASLFYPGSMSINQATRITVNAGAVTAGINIATTAQSAVTMYDDVLYSYLDNNTIGPLQPAVMNLSTGPATLVASGYGLGSNGQAPGLSFGVIGDSILVQNNGIRPYQANGYTYIALDLSFNLWAQTGPQHAIFTTPNSIYVLPAGINVTQAPPPTVTAVSSNGDGTVTITGTNWASDTLLYFDGLPSSIISLNASTGTAAGTAIVQPPPGASAQQAIITAYNSDGQNSEYVQSASPVTYAYPNAAAPVINTITPASLPAGAEASIDITGTNFNFTQAQTAVGFGTSDISVQRIFVLSPTHLQVDVSVSPNAALSSPDVSIMAGFQLATATAGFQITPQVAGLPAPVPPLVNAVPGLSGAYPGAAVSLYGLNLVASSGTTGSGTPVVTIAGQSVPILYASASQLNLQLPASLTPGPAILTLNNGALAAYPITVNIDTLPASINAIQNSTGAYIDSTQAAHPGDQLIVTLSNFAPSGTNIPLTSVTVDVGGISHPATQITQAGSVWQVTFQLNSTDPVGQAEQLVVYLNGRSSYPATIPVASH